MANRKTAKKKAKQNGQTLLSWEELIKMSKEKNENERKKISKNFR